MRKKVPFAKGFSFEGTNLNSTGDCNPMVLDGGDSKLLRMLDYCVKYLRQYVHLTFTSPTFCCMAQHDKKATLVSNRTVCGTQNISINYLRPVLHSGGC